MIWKAIGHCRKCLGVTRTANTTCEPTTRPVRRELRLIRRIHLHGSHNRIILSVGVSHFDFFHR